MFYPSLSRRDRRQVDPFFRMFDEFFERGTPVTAQRETAFVPQVDVLESKAGFEISVDLPGVKKDDIEVRVEEGRLVLSGERKTEVDEKKKNSHYVERSFGRFERVFSLPKEVNPDKIEARHDDGVLKISLLKDEKATTKQIEVKSISAA